MSDRTAAFVGVLAMNLGLLGFFEGAMAAVGADLTFMAALIIIVVADLFFLVGYHTIKLIDYYQENTVLNDLGLPEEEELSTDAEYHCSYCGDPVKKGDRVLYYGTVYCTLEHLEADKE